MAVITRSCETCKGIGSLVLVPGPTEPVNCWICGGDGLVLIGENAELDRLVVVEEKVAVLEERLAAPRIYPAWQVLEATEIGEYTALSASNKTTYSLILSVGFVKLVEGSNAWTLLASMFGPGSVTRANLLALIS